MQEFDKKSSEYDEGIRHMYSFYKSEYERAKNKMPDSRPYLNSLVNKIKELRKELKW